MMIERNRLSKNVREQNMSNKTLQKVSRLTLILGTALSMTGCASWFTIGESEYSCQMVGEGTKCTNSWDIYKLTNGGKTPSEIKKEQEDSNKTDSENGATDDNTTNNTETQGTNDYVIDNFVTPNLPNRPVPVRTPAIVMRVWFSPYTDADGNFVVPGYSYIEIEPRKWTLGVHNTGTSNSASRVFEPLKTQSVKKSK